MDYGGSLTDYKDRVDKCSALMGNYLNKSQLSLFLGAGVSYALNMSGWESLVLKCLKIALPLEPTKVGYTTEELKKLTSKIKAVYATNPIEFLELVQNQLYDGVDFDFKLAKKEILIAITALMVGKVRGNIKNIMTLNFDSVLEWYLYIHGLNIGVVSKNHLAAKKSADVEIIHLHGFLPHDSKYGQMSNEIVFTHEEFLVRERGDSYWKELMNEFFKKHVFLTVGMSPASIIADVVPYLITLNELWYKREGFDRMHPYGVAYLTDCEPWQADYMLTNGIIPCVIKDRDQIPSAIFSIAQQALGA